MLSSVSTGKGKSILEDNVEKPNTLDVQDNMDKPNTNTLQVQDNVDKPNTNTLEVIAEEPRSKGNVKNGDRVDSRELASILMTTPDEERKETFTQTSVLNTVPTTVPEKVDIANQTSIESNKQIQTHNQVATIRSIYSKFKKHDNEIVPGNQYPRNEMTNINLDSGRCRVTETDSKLPIEIKEVEDDSSEDNSEAKRERPYIGGPTQSIASLDKVIRDLKEFKRIYKMFECNKIERNENTTSSSCVKTLVRKKFGLKKNSATNITQSVDRNKIKRSMKFEQSKGAITESAPGSMIRYKINGNETLTKKLDTDDNSHVSAICKLKRNGHENDQQNTVKITKAHPQVKELGSVETVKPKQTNNIPQKSETMDLCKFASMAILPRSHGISNGSEEEETHFNDKKINKKEMDLCKYLPDTILSVVVAGKSTSEENAVGKEKEEKSISTYKAKQSHTNENKRHLRENGSSDDDKRNYGKQIISIFNSRHIPPNEKETNKIEKSNNEDSKENEHDKVLTVFKSKRIHHNGQASNLIENNNNSEDNKENEHDKVVTMFKSKQIHRNEQKTNLGEKSNSEDNKENEHDKIVTMFKSKQIHRNAQKTNLRENSINDDDERNEEKQFITIYKPKHIHLNESHTHLVQDEHETNIGLLDTIKQLTINEQSNSKEHPKKLQKDQTTRSKAKNKTKKSEVDRTVTIFKDVANMILESCLGMKEIDSKKIDYIDHLLAFIDRANAPSTSRQYNTSVSQIIITDLEDDLHENLRTGATVSSIVQPSQATQNEKRGLEQTIGKIIPIITSHATISMESEQRMDDSKTIEASTNFEKLKDLFENQNHATANERVLDIIELKKIRDTQQPASVKEGVETKPGHKTKEEAHETSEENE
ncbi:hypothetical protein WDU94_004876 [Cyamophila willieti]